VNAYEVKRQVWCLLQVKLCAPCLSALEWFVYHTRRYTSARIYLTLPLTLVGDAVRSRVAEVQQTTGDERLINDWYNVV